MIGQRGGWARRTIDALRRAVRDGDPDPGEVVWTWVPYGDDPSQGKDREGAVLERDRFDALVRALRAHHGIVVASRRRGRYASRGSVPARQPSPALADRPARPTLGWRQARHVVAPLLQNPAPTRFGDRLASSSRRTPQRSATATNGNNAPTSARGRRLSAIASSISSGYAFPIGERQPHLLRGQWCTGEQRLERAEVLEHVDDLPGVESGADHPRAASRIFASECEPRRRSTA